MTYAMTDLMSPVTTPVTMPATARAKRPDGCEIAAEPAAASTVVADPQILTVTGRSEWRAWLAANSDDTPEVWLVIGPCGSGAATISHCEAIEEALRFGWIDSLARRHDQHSWRQRFSPRGPRSAWSNLNRHLVDSLDAQGLMTPRGRAVVDAAKATGMWSLLADAQNGIIPEDLRVPLSANHLATRHYNAFSPSTQRAILEWITRAQRPAVRQRRITRTLSALTANHWPPATDPR